MVEAENIARSRGYHGAWLDTSIARTERFYRRLGYTLFRVLTNGPRQEPQGHRRAFLTKQLIGSASPEVYAKLRGEFVQKETL